MSDVVSKAFIDRPITEQLRSLNVYATPRMRQQAADEIERLQRQDIDGLHSVRVATIEECARVADQWSLPAFQGKAIAEHIRTLKEQK